MRQKSCWLYGAIRTWVYGDMAPIVFLPTGSEEREVLGVGSIPVAILPSCQDVKTIAV